MFSNVSFWKESGQPFKEKQLSLGVDLMSYFHCFHLKRKISKLEARSSVFLVIIFPNSSFHYLKKSRSIASGDQHLWEQKPRNKCSYWPLLFINAWLFTMAKKHWHVFRNSLLRFYKLHRPSIQGKEIYSRFLTSRFPDFNWDFYYPSRLCLRWCSGAASNGGAVTTLKICDRKLSDGLDLFSTQKTILETRNWLKST